MKIPNSLRIGGIEYEIRRKDQLTDDTQVLCGRALVMQEQIEVYTAFGYQTQCVTLLHEVLHVIEIIRGLELGEKREHIIDTFAYGLYQLLQDNGGRLVDLEQPQPSRGQAADLMGCEPCTGEGHRI